jgi:hypothetical protein
MVINKDFRAFIQCLKDHNVQYLIVGGYAVALHGHPRYTKDLDVWISISVTNADKVVAAIKDFGFSSLQLQSEDFTQPDTIIQLGYPPNRIDLITSASGIDFSHAWPDRVVVNIEGLEINFIDLINLKKNKKASGRYQDLADIENLGGF